MEKLTIDFYGICAVLEKQGVVLMPHGTECDCDMRSGGPNSMDHHASNADGTSHTAPPHSGSLVVNARHVAVDGLDWLPDSAILAGSEKYLVWNITGRDIRILSSVETQGAARISLPPRNANKEITNGKVGLLMLDDFYPTSTTRRDFDTMSGIGRIWVPGGGFEGTGSMDLEAIGPYPEGQWGERLLWKAAKSALFAVQDSQRRYIPLCSDPDQLLALAIYVSNTPTQPSETSVGHFDLYYSLLSQYVPPRIRPVEKKAVAVGGGAAKTGSLNYPSDNCGPPVGLPAVG